MMPEAFRLYGSLSSAMSYRICNKSSKRQNVLLVMDVVVLTSLEVGEQVVVRRKKLVVGCQAQARVLKLTKEEHKLRLV